MSVDDLERKYFLKTLSAFKFYRPHALKKIRTQMNVYDKLPKRQKGLIPDFVNHMNALEDCVKTNSEFIDQIISNAKAEIFEGDHFLAGQTPSIDTVVHNGDCHGGIRLGVTSNDLDKVRSTLKQFVRDWSALGESERKASYQPVLEKINALYALPEVQLSQIRVLVPGAGLGRLAWELARCGFICQGNEWSLYMLLSAHFVLNTCKSVNQYKLHPWVTQFCNNQSRESQLAAVTVPDVSPSELPSDSQFSMVAGDFLEIYTEPASWDCVATVFFIDTAHNILDYLEAIWNILIPDGYWVNFGPLLYHFADIHGQDSIELSYAEVRKAAELIGFEVLSEELNLPSTYTQDPKSMLQYTYRCALSVFRKPKVAPFSALSPLSSQAE